MSQTLPPSLPVPALPPPTLPAIPARQEQDPAQRLLQEQKDRARQREIDQSPPQISAPSLPSFPDLPPGADVETMPETGSTFLVDKIDFSGETVLSAGRLQDVVTPFLHKQLGRNRINLLLRRLTQAYIDAGYITTRAYLGQQNLASGTLVVTIVPGRIEAFMLNGAALRPTDPKEHWYQHHGGGLLTDAGTAWAFPPSTGDVLRLPDLEQGVDQINRLRRNQAEIQILPGQASGDSIVSVTNKYSGPFSYALGIDNYGSQATGRLRYRGSLEADNLIGLQESLSLSFVGSDNTNALVFSTAVPYGNQTFSYTSSLSEYQEVIGGTALLWGRTLSQILGWNDVLYRSKTGRLSVDATFTKMRTDRTVNESDLDPQNLTVARVALSALHHFTANGADAAISVEGGVTRGMPWLDASRDAPDISGEDAHSQFTKYDTSATLTLPLPHVLDHAFVYRSSLNAQYSHVALFDSQQIFLGGMDTVRGFLEGGISGDSGFYMRNEIAWGDAPVLHNVRWEPYVFFDGGKAHLNAQGGWPTLAGTGIGARAQWKAWSHDMSCEVLIGRAIQQPNSLGSKASVALATLNFSG
ncbi:ShlB/FhaC/HecB family hemolysin secretion/activation protein [Pararobbsia alpina]|uniref:ShlB/FhaC/HecB family hemolysin secretion/activation protein n=1 Tax=Pararobbsia alpina TaxID=621374 RepID=UPI0039A68741